MATRAARPSCSAFIATRCATGSRSTSSSAGSAATPSRRSRARTRADVLAPTSASTTAQDIVRVLIVDDHRDFAENLAELGRINGLAPVICGSCATARTRIRKEVFDVAIVDHRLPDGLGIDLLADLKASCPDIVTIVVTAVVSLDDTLAALNQGAFAFMAKDSDPDELLAIVARAAENA